MSRNTNIPFAVIPTSGNQAVAAAGTQLSALAAGKIGVFSARSNVALNGSSVVGPAREIFIAAGTTTNGKADIIRSAGQSIDIKNVVGYTLRCYSPSREQITDISDLDASCGSQYLVKFDMVVPDAFIQYGFNGFTKTFNAESDCCADCDCSGGDCKQIYTALRDAINADEDGLLNAYLIDPADVADPAAAELSAGELTALVGCPVLRVVSVSQAIRTFCGIPNNFQKNMQFTFTTTLLDGFECAGTVTVRQTSVIEEGSGEWAAFMEYTAAGWEGSPYRQTESGIDLNVGAGKVDKTANYVVLTISHNDKSTAGWLEYSSPLNTYIFLPCADATTINGLLGVLDLLFAESGMSPLEDDYATCGACNEVNTSGEDSTPGIG